MIVIQPLFPPWGGGGTTSSEVVSLSFLHFIFTPIQKTPRAQQFVAPAASAVAPDDLRKRKTTLSNGYLGSRNDEERSEMRYVMRIAELSESSNL
jgi:hypothetical protein